MELVALYSLSLLNLSFVWLSGIQCRPGSPSLGLRGPIVSSGQWVVAELADAGEGWGGGGAT